MLTKWSGSRIAPESRLVLPLSILTRARSNPKRNITNPHLLASTNFLVSDELFSIDETLLDTRYSIPILMEDVQVNYILLVQTFTACSQHARYTESTHHIPLVRRKTDSSQDPLHCGTGSREYAPPITTILRYLILGSAVNLYLLMIFTSFSFPL